jgi:hypothetical protein
LMLSRGRPSFIMYILQLMISRGGPSFTISIDAFREWGKVIYTKYSKQ